MSDGRSPELEELLQAAVLGEVELEDPRIVRACAADPTFAEELSGARQVIALLEREGVLAEAEALERAAAAPPPPQGSRVLRLLRWLSVAAALLLIFGGLGTWIARDRGAPAVPDMVLGPVALRCLPSEAAGSGPPTFRWTASTDTGSFVVEVYDDEGNLLVRSPRLEGTAREWTPEEPIPAPPGGALHWQVTWFDSDSQPRDQANRRISI